MLSRGLGRTRPGCNRLDDPVIAPLFRGHQPKRPSWQSHLIALRKRDFGLPLFFGGVYAVTYLCTYHIAENLSDKLLVPA